jgi:hypothetical protein
MELKHDSLTARLPQTSTKSWWRFLCCSGAEAQREMGEALWEKQERFSYREEEGRKRW